MLSFDEVRRAEQRLSPTQRHVILRFSEAEEWGGSGYGMARSWNDLVYGRKWASYRTLQSLVSMGVAQRLADSSFRLTPLGLAVQYRVRGWSK